jgi:hypothetical protein
MTSDYPKMPRPKWLGEESIAGKTIVVHTDEGMGDCIQFVRYVPMMVERGARVVLVVAAPLVALLSGVKSVSQCFSSGAAPAFECIVRCAACRSPSRPASIPFRPKCRICRRRPGTVGRVGTIVWVRMTNCGWAGVGRKSQP